MKEIVFHVIPDPSSSKKDDYSEKFYTRDSHSEPDLRNLDSRYFDPKSLQSREFYPRNLHPKNLQSGDFYPRNLPPKNLQQNLLLDDIFDGEELDCYEMIVGEAIYRQ